VVSVFDDWFSLLHFALGVLCVFLKYVSVLLSVAVVATFTLYEWYEVEPEENRLGDFIEFLTGFAVGVLLFTP